MSQQLHEMGFTSIADFVAEAISSFPPAELRHCGLSPDEVHRMATLLSHESFQEGYRFKMRDRTWLNAHPRAEQTITQLLVDYGTSRLPPVPPITR